MSCNYVIAFGQKGQWLNPIPRRKIPVELVKMDSGRPIGGGGAD